MAVPTASVPPLADRVDREIENVTEFEIRKYEERKNGYGRTEEG
jgi:hypothetical protein